MTYTYTLTYEDGYSFVEIPELEGEKVIKRPSEYFCDDKYLDITHFSFTATFDPIRSDEFTTIAIQKEGGDSQMARATSYYERLTREEAEYIVGEFIRVSLGIRDFELEPECTDDMIEENEEFFDEKDDNEIEEDIHYFLLKEKDDFEELDEYLGMYEDSYSDDIYEFAFREAIRQGNEEYIEEHADDFDLNDAEGYSSYIYETKDDRIIGILMDHGALKSIDDYVDCRFAIETVNGSIISFRSDFQQEVFNKYLKTFGLTEEKIVQLLDPDEEPEDDDFDRCLEDDMEALGVEVEDNHLAFRDICGEDNFNTQDLIEELGWCCEFEGDSWKLETVGVNFIK